MALGLAERIRTKCRSLVASGRLTRRGVRHRRWNPHSRFVQFGTSVVLSSARSKCTLTVRPGHERSSLSAAKRNPFDRDFHCPELQAVFSTTALRGNSVVQGDDGLAADLGNRQVVPACHTSATWRAFELQAVGSEGAVLCRYHPAISLIVSRQRT